MSEVKGVKVLAHRADILERGQLRTLVDNLRNKLGSGVVVLGSAQDGKVALIVGVTQGSDSAHAGRQNHRRGRENVGGSGGGRPTWPKPAAKISRNSMPRSRLPRMPLPNCLAKFADLAETVYVAKFITTFVVEEEPFVDIVQGQSRKSPRLIDSNAPRHDLRFQSPTRGAG